MTLRFRQSPETFSVTEIPLFEPSGEGEHLYLTLRKRGLSTPHLLSRLERMTGLKEVDLGCAGNKDRDAVTVQTISLPASREAQAIQALEALGVELLAARRHPHKLRTGKLAGNRFEIRLELEDPIDFNALAQGCEGLAREGVPNAFGPQRFADPESVDLGRRLFLGQRVPGPFRKARFAVSVFQGAIFNALLELRRQNGTYPGPLPGDLMKRHDSGGEFLADGDPELSGRVARLEVSPTGPIPGQKMAKPQGEALALEEEVYDRFGISTAQMALTKAPGTRRFLRVPIGNLQCYQASETEVVLSFSLPPGSYATVLLRELDVTLCHP